MRTHHGRRKRVALSSVYGFIVIYLLVVASLQAISLSLSASESANEAADHAAQVGQLRSVEHLRVKLSLDGNVSIMNDGLIPSTVSFLLLQNSSVSRQVPLHQSLAVGGSASTSLKTSATFPSAVAAVTSLGNVFVASSSSPSGVNWKTLEGALGGPGVDAQLYQNPSDPTRFFVAEGSSALAFSTARGAPLWSFNAGQGEVTDILPLSDGEVYVSNGYFGNQYASNLYTLTSSGTSLWTYSMRLLRSYTNVEIQYPDNDVPPYPVGSQPVQKGADGPYAFYDGWFFSSSGVSSTTVPADSYSLAGAGDSQFYLYRVVADPSGFGCYNPRGNVAQLFAYSANSLGVMNQWSSSVFFNSCNLYPEQLISSSAGSGVVALLFAEVYNSQPNYFGGPYQGANPFLAVLSSGGQILRSGNLDDNGYTSLTTDGTHVYLSIPSTKQVEVVSASGGGVGAFYDVGISANNLVWADNSLFLISDSQVKVYDSSMNLKKTVDFSPQTFYSVSTSKPLESQMVSPSFLVLNSTSYAALLRNSTGYGSLVIGAFSP